MRVSEEGNIVSENSMARTGDDQNYTQRILQERKSAIQLQAAYTERQMSTEINSLLPTYFAQTLHMTRQRGGPGGIFFPIFRVSHGSGVGCKCI